MTRRVVYVISDLHLGGEPGTEMCSVEGRGRLVKFLTQLGDEAAAEGEQGDKGARIHLVIAGDIVDFLAVPLASGGWSAFVASEEAALRGFRTVRKQTREVWKALRDAVGKGIELTILLGNHDIELSLPEVRRELLQTIGPGMVEFIYDNAAFRLGPLLVEHGNRYDAWNAVSHDSLRRARSRSSRGEAAVTFPTQPGSELVARVMNKVKETYGFVDLLKPETSAALPLLAALKPALWLTAWPAVYQAARKAWRAGHYDSEGRPTENDEVAARISPAARADVASDLVAEERARTTVEAGAVPADEFPFRDAFEVALGLAKESSQEGSEVSWLKTVNRKALLWGLRYWMSHDKLTWNASREAETYHKPAEALARAGARVIVFGHTHLAKRVELERGAIYLNSGTWADLMRLPPKLLADDSKTAADELDRLLGQLESNRLEGLRRCVPTFARVRFTEGDSGPPEADVYFMDGDGGREKISDPGFEKRLLAPLESA